MRSFQSKIQNHSYFDNFVDFETNLILSKALSQGVFEDWEYKLISLFEPKLLDLAFKYFLIQEAGSAIATKFYDQLKLTNK